MYGVRLAMNVGGIAVESQKNVFIWWSFMLMLINVRECRAT